jgi:quinol monooxygenase YgiN
MPIPRLVIVAYRPKPGKAAALLSEVRDHHKLLRSEGLATDREPTIMRSTDGSIVEVFEWASPAAIEEAHGNPRVQAMWQRFAAVSDYAPLNTLPESEALFAEFEPVVFDHTRPPDPPPSERAE